MTDDSFFSINKLVEFGIGLTVAQQMIKTMNHSIENMTVAGVSNEMQQNRREYYAVVDGLQVGPLNEKEVGAMIVSHKIDKGTLMWTRGLSAWKFAEELSEVNRLFILSPPKLL